MTKSTYNSALQETIGRHVSKYHPLTFLNSINYATLSSELSHISFPGIANNAIGALFGVNVFAFTYPVDVIQGSKKRSFGVKC